jgi:hypothetical protein
LQGWVRSKNNNDNMDNNNNINNNASSGLVSQCTRTRPPTSHTLQMSAAKSSYHFPLFWPPSDKVYVWVKLPHVGAAASSSSHSASSAAAAIKISVFAGNDAEKAEDFAEDVREGVLEVAIRHDVDDRVEGGVEVSDPKKDVHHNVWKQRNTKLTLYNATSRFICTCPSSMSAGVRSKAVSEWKYWPNIGPKPNICQPPIPKIEIMPLAIANIQILKKQKNI